MAKFQAKVTINRPVDQVFRFVVDPMSYPKWMNGVSDVKLTTGSRLGVGTQVLMKGKEAMWSYDNAPMEITEYEANKRLGIKATIPGKMQFAGIWSFEPKGDSATRLTSSGETHLLGLWRIAEPLMGGEVQKGEAEELNKIKGILESLP